MVAAEVQVNAAVTPENTCATPGTRPGFVSRHNLGSQPEAVLYSAIESMNRRGQTTAWQQYMRWAKLLFYGFLAGALGLEKTGITKRSNFRNLLGLSSISVSH